MRAALYMVALVAKKVGFVACILKLLTILNTMPRTGQPWDGNYTRLGSLRVLDVQDSC